MLSDAVAVSVVAPDTVAAFVGAVIATVGGVLSPGEVELEDIIAFTAND